MLEYEKDRIKLLSNHRWGQKHEIADCYLPLTTSAEILFSTRSFSNCTELLTDRWVPLI